MFSDTKFDAVMSGSLTGDRPMDNGKDAWMLSFLDEVEVRADPQVSSKLAWSTALALWISHGDRPASLVARMWLAARTLEWASVRELDD
jgi:hypothetical protein